MDEVAAGYAFDPTSRVLAHFRTSLHPVEMHGHALSEHAKLMFPIAGANRGETWMYRGRKSLPVRWN